MKKILLLMLTVVTLGFFAGSVSAQTVWDGTTDISWYDDGQTSFDISTPEQLAGVAQLVNSGTSFNGKTLNLTADIWLNSTGDSTNNWIPIGGSATASGEDQSAGNAFQGVFNAHGHSIYNLYCEKQNYFHAGLFGCIKNPCTIDSLVMVNPVLKSKGMMGAITGMTRSGGAIYIRYCLVINGRMQGTGGNNIGFIVGANYPNSSGTQIQNCGATGTITGNYPGGLGGNSQNETFTNCYFAGSITGSPSGGIAAYSGTLNNCYSYVSTSVSGGNNGNVVTQAEMQDAQMITNLGDAFKMDNGVNNGYPVMSYMSGVDPISAEICQGESITISAFGFDTYAWSNGATTESITVSPTSTTAYTVTCTSNGVSTVLTSTITVFPQAEITAMVVPSSDGQTHATLNQTTFTVGCGSSDNITLVVTPETNYRVCRVTLNGTQIYGDDFGEGPVNITVNPGGTLGEVKVFLSNEYTISITELLDTGDTLHLSSLVQPYGSNGIVTVNAGTDQTFTFNNTARYVLVDAVIDDGAQGVVNTYEFQNIHENHTIVLTYVDSCGISALPFFDDLEWTTASTVPDCYEAIQYSSYPYIQNSATNAHSGSKSFYAYMSGSSYTYYIVLPKIVDTVAYPLSDLKVSFWGRTSNASNSFTVGVMSDPTDLSTFTTVSTLPATSTSYAEYTCYIGVAGHGHEYIAIKFNCGANYTNSSIDDITVDFAPQCSPVTNLHASSVFGSNATIAWSPNSVGTASDYTIHVYDMANETESTYTTTETSYTIMGLSELTPYQVGVFVNCDNGESSDTTFLNFMTPCNNPVNYSVGNSTTTNNYLPTNIYYGNSYSQQIVTASVFEGTANDFASISVKDNTTSATVRACDIYLAHVPANMNLANDWILPSASNNITFTLVFSGNVNFGTGDWVTIDFDTLFPYNGTDNLLVVFNDHTNSYTLTHTYDVVENTNTSSMARYMYRDGTPYDAFNPGTQSYSAGVLNVVNTLRFGYCDASTCIVPNTVTASNVTQNAADITWISAGSESSWEVEYKADADADWTSAGTVTSTQISLFDLNGNTLYHLRVRAICGSDEMSVWSPVISFRTECASISQLPYSEDFEDLSSIYSTSQDNYILCWDRYASDPSHYVYVSSSSSYAHNGSRFLDFHHTTGCFNIAILPPIDASINISDLMVSFYACRSGNTGYLEVGVMSDKTDPTTFVVMDTIDLSSYNTYDYGLQQVSFENYSDNGHYIAFRVSNAVGCGYYIDEVLLEERPNCMYPTNIHATNISSDNVTLAWTETGSATAWNIIYGEVGFDPEEGGTIVSADANPFTVTDLLNATSYDFYVQADCGGLQSPWNGPLNVKTGVYNMGVTGSDTLTTCGVYIYDDGGADGNYSLNCNYTLVVYPETEGSGLAISGTVNTYSNYASYNGVVTIYGGVGTSGVVLGTYTGVHTVNLAYGGPVTINFTSGSYYNYAGFELLVQCTDCYPPTNVAVSNQTLDGATVTWSGNADSYEVVIGGAMTATYTTSDTTYTFTDLMSSSSYTVKVRGICGSQYSLYSQAASFNTSCGAITITAENPWFEDFEGYSGGGSQPFVCWDTPVTEVVDNGTSPFVYCGHSPSCHSGSNSAELKGSNNMLVLPEFSNDIQELRLSFWATTTSTSNYGTVEVGYITDIADPTSFVALGPAGVPGPRGSSGSGSGHGNYMGPFDFNGVTATSARMAIKFTGYSGLSWNLDDFTVSLAPNCPSPVKTSVQASNVDGHNATITFTDDDPDHNSWTVYYKPSADSVWETEVTNTTTATLTNLNPQTTYDVYVVTNCTTPEEEEDATLTIHFTTTVACPAPQNLTVSNIDMTTATVTWFSNADSFTIEYGETGFAVGTGTTATITTTSYDLTGLTSGTTYTVYVTADCGADGNSTSASVDFSTTICAAADQCAFTFTLEDSFGDGWNGGTLSVKQNNITVATLGLSSGSSATAVVNLCDNVSTSLVWTSGSYAYEAGFSITGPDGTVLFSHDSMSTYTTYTFTTDCSGSGPVITDPTVVTNPATNVAQTTATLNGTITNPDNVTLTAQGFEWKVSTAADYTVVNATGNAMTHNLSNLTENTTYTYRAFITFNGSTVYGSDVTFTTLQQGQAQEPSATTAAATNITETAATLNGSITNPDNVTITAKGFEWKATAGGAYAPVTVAGDNFTYNLTGLTANTNYTFKAFITYNGATVYGDEMTFTTLPEDTPEPCETPTNLHASEFDAHSITIGWNANGNATSWNIRYRVENGDWNNANATTNTYVISGLAAETVYEIEVQANCGNGNLSDWSAPIHICTAPDGIENWLENSVTLFPNPANNVVNVECTMYNVQSVEVFDVYGKLVNTVGVCDTPVQTRINVSSLANGMYFVRVTTEKGVVTKSFVKK